MAGIVGDSPCKIDGKHPQSNGKVEKVGGIMRKLVEHFGTLEHALYYYNFERPHWSLNIEVCETPFRAFLRKMRPEQRGAFVRANGALVAQHAPEYLNFGGNSEIGGSGCLT
jgi:hypothetical protein